MEVKNALFFSDDTIKYIKREVKNFKNDKHNPQVIYDGVQRKKRTIIVPSLREQIIHHVIVESFGEMFLQGIYKHAYGSIPGRGAHKGAKVMMNWIRKDPENCKYVLKLDIRKYFESISHDILKKKLSRVVKDKEALKLLFEVIDVTDKGLPLGFYTSQWLSMWYLKDFDHFVKEQCYAPHYMRYMDDIVILGGDKEKLIETLNKVTEYLRQLGLELNSKSQLFQFCWYDNEGYKHGRDIDFMGFRFFPDRKILRKSIMIKMTRKAKNIFTTEGKPTIYQLRQIISYMSYIKNSKVYGVWLEYLKPVLDYKKARKKIGNYDRKLNKIKIKLAEREFDEMFDAYQQGKIHPIMAAAAA